MTANDKPTVAVLFAQARTHYRELPGVEVWDRRRDARGYPGPHPVVAHPPCRVYSRYLSKQAKAPPHEYTFAIFALAAVRAYGGVKGWSRYRIFAFVRSASLSSGRPPGRCGSAVANASPGFSLAT